MNMNMNMIHNHITHEYYSYLKSRHGVLANSKGQTHNLMAYTCHNKSLNKPIHIRNDMTEP